MTSAFQPDAFQNNAFQIDVVDGGAGSSSTSSSGKRKRRLTQSDISDLLDEYRRALEEKLEPKIEKAIISAINPFVMPQTREEIARHNRASFLFDTPPEAERINFQLLQQNQISLGRLRAALEEIRLLQEEEELAVLLLLIN